MDPISLIVGAGLVGVGWVVGRFGHRMARGKAEGTSPALCGCGHDLSLHDRKAGECHAEYRRKSPWGYKEWARCGCRHYTGPTPLEELFPTPLLPPLNDPR
ncbi:hypothetical protein [Nocardia sp. NPDC050406]|uniref:hypothetical protein n=1 Tax=Nocardia sp. NPDC050406 TaxID=3364318 RepID=UPI00379DCD10